MEDEIQTNLRARAKAALNRIREKAKADGLDRMTIDEIDAVIAEARREKRRGK